MGNANLEMLRIAVEHLGPLADELVFVGGCTTGLFVTDAAAAEVRPTDDVDTIVEATTYVQSLEILRAASNTGFQARYKRELRFAVG